MTEASFTLSESELRALATEIKADPLSFDPASMRKAIVTAVSLATSPPTVTIQLSGDTTVSIPDVRVERGYIPVVGDTALVFKQGNELLAWGSVATASYGLGTTNYVRYSRSSGQSVSHNTITKVAFPTADVTDTSLVAMSNDRDFSLLKSGIYSITGTQPWASAAAGSRWAWFGLDTDSSIRWAVATGNPNNSAACLINVSVTRRFTAGTAVSAYAYQDSGVSQSLFPSGTGPLDINIAYLGP